MFQKVFYFIVFLSHLVGTCNAWSSEKSSPQMENGMEGLFGSKSAASPTSAGQSIVAKTLADLPKGGLENENLPCRVLYLGYWRDKKGQQEYISKISDFSEAELLETQRIVSHNAKVYSACLAFIKSLKNSAQNLPKALLKALHTQCTSYYLSVQAANTVLEAIKGMLADKQVEVKGETSAQEPRLSQINYLSARNYVHKVVIPYKPISRLERAQELLTAFPELEAYFIKDSSLNLDFMLLQHQTVGATAAHVALGVQKSVYLKNCKANLQNAREACASWGIPDAYTREIPHNFKNETTHFGHCEVVFKDGRIARAITSTAPVANVGFEPSHMQGRGIESDALTSYGNGGGKCNEKTASAAVPQSGLIPLEEFLKKLSAPSAVPPSSVETASGLMPLQPSTSITRKRAGGSTSIEGEKAKKKTTLTRGGSGTAAAGEILLFMQQGSRNKASKDQ